MIHRNLVTQSDIDKIVECDNNERFVSLLKGYVPVPEWIDEMEGE
jgi:hypothetical protein